MERKRIEKLVALLLVGILIPVSLFPLRINADTITNSNVNINYYLDSVTETASGTYMQTYKVEFVFDQSYLGWISSKMVGTYVSNNTIPVTTSQFTKTQAIYVNGVTAETSFTFVTPNNMNGGALQSLSQSIQNSNVTPLADLSTLDDILNVLIDINDNIEIDVIQELQSIVSNTSLANDYLDIISKIRQFDIPFESISFVSALLTRYSNKLSFFFGDNNVYVNYPVFKLDYGDFIAVRGDLKDQFVLIFGINLDIPNKSSFINNLVYNNSITTSDIIEYYHLQYINISGVGNINIYKVVFNRSNSPILRVMNNNGFYFMPIYFNHTNNNISTEFALRWGLSNSLLDNIQIIANGTNQSNSASGSLDQATSQFSDDANDLVTIEESFNNSMNSSLQNVNPTFNMGSSFLTSANWVSQQFNRIVNNTPFASLITFGLTLGLGLLIIGKVRK